MPEPRLTYQRSPVIERVRNARFELGGVIGERIRAAVDGWLLPAPHANPALIEMFCDRERKPSRDLVPWAGEFVGKYLIGAIQVWRLTGHEALGETIRQTVSELLDVQADDGYLGPFNGDERLVAKWDVWGHYHVMLALLMYYQDTGNEAVLAACERIGRLLHGLFVLSGRRMITPDDPDGEKNYAVSHALLHLYRLTGNENHRELVAWIESEWDRPPAGRYMSSALAGKPVWEFPAHRWESVHNYQAIGELALITGADTYRRATDHIWWSILEGDRHNTGGFTSGEACQGNPYDPGAIETCCTVAWIAYSIDMLRITGDSRVADEIELSTLNGMVGGQTPSGRWWTYNTPMDGVRKASAHEIVFQARAGSPEFNCCSANAPRGLGMIGEWALMTSEGGFALAYYGPSVIAAPLPSGGEVAFRQHTSYPLDGAITIELSLPRPEAFTLGLRIPAWSRDTAVRLNGGPVPGVTPGRYLPIGRTWRDGDRIDLTLDFCPHLWVGERECAGKVSLYRGPILLAYDPRYNQFDPDDLPTLDVNRLRMEPTTWDGAFPPWFLVRVPTTDGRGIVLCDFASAGVTGTHYRSWLPAIGGKPMPFSRERAAWVGNHRG